MSDAATWLLWFTNLTSQFARRLSNATFPTPRLKQSTEFIRKKIESRRRKFVWDVQVARIRSRRQVKYPIGSLPESSSHRSWLWALLRPELRLGALLTKQVRSWKEKARSLMTQTCTGQSNLLPCSVEDDANENCPRVTKVIRYWATTISTLVRRLNYQLMPTSCTFRQLIRQSCGHMLVLKRWARLKLLKKH